MFENIFKTYVYYTLFFGHNGIIRIEPRIIWSPIDPDNRGCTVYSAFNLVHLDRSWMFPKSRNIFSKQYASMWKIGMMDDWWSIL